MQDWKTELEQKRETYRTEHNLPKIYNYGLAKSHHEKSKEIYDFISKTDLLEKLLTMMYITYFLEVMT